MPIAALLWAPEALAAQTSRLVLLEEGTTGGCVDQAELERGVAERLGYQPFEAGASSTILVRVTSTDAALTGTIEVVDADHRLLGKRELASGAASCEELQRALALSLSIAIDPERALAEPAASEQPLAQATAAAPPRPADPEQPVGTPVAAHPPAAAPSPTADRATPPPPPAKAFTGSLAALSMFGVAPSPAFGLQLMARQRWGHFSVGVGGRAARSAWADVDNGARLHATVGTGQLEACWHARLVEACALGLVGATWVRADDVDVPRTDVGAFGGVGLGIGVGAPLSGALAWFAGGDVLGVASPVEAEVDGSAVWLAPAVAGSVAAGIRARFW